MQILRRGAAERGAAAHADMQRERRAGTVTSLPEEQEMGEQHWVCSQHNVPWALVSALSGKSWSFRAKQSFKDRNLNKKRKIKKDSATWWFGGGTHL